MSRILVTGFDPFGGQKINPAWEAVRRLPDRIHGAELVKIMVPTVYGKAYETTLSEAERVNPDAVILVGQAGGRDAITPEMVAVNLRYAAIADNAGVLLQDVPVKPDGPAAYFATLPVRKMTEAVNAEGIPAKVSYSAGTFVCNDLFYLTADHFAGQKTGVCFIHVPFLPEQAEEEYPSMTLEEIVKGLTAAIGIAAESISEQKA